ncbi:MAG: sigma-70 family RNA polymerase sigma factor [Pyrinomonadaceae bacterium]|nr:sigma-70 family RNA polymerase sigma factor [Pyrinomonadaceae bacterium]
MRNLSDEELVHRVSDGDDRALSEIYDRYSRAVYATGVRLLADASLAEDLVQEAFTNVWRGAGTFDSERGSFATWLYRITRNRAIDLDRKRRVRPSVTGVALPDNVPGGLEPEVSVNSWDVSQALSRIPDRHREILSLAYFEDLSQKEISWRTDLPLGTVKSRTTAALKALGKALRNPCSSEVQGD